MDMLSAIRVFQKVAITLSFTETANLLGLTPSSVSRQIDALQERLGVRLLSRSTRKITLTHEGEQYKQQMDEILAEFDAVNESVATRGDSVRGTLKVSAPRVLGRKLISPLVTQFLGIHPGLKLELSLTDHYVDLVETNTDVAIRIGALRESSLISLPLGNYRRILAAAPVYLQNKPLPETPGDLIMHNCLGYRQSGERVLWRFQTKDTAAPLAHLPQGDLLTNDMEILLHATLAGAGIAILPHWLAREHLESGALTALLPAYPVLNSTQMSGIHFVYLLNRRQSRKVHAFMDFIIEQIQPQLA
jgi:DNA-binding transcriptional LysR family regulator